MRLITTEDYSLRLDWPLYVAFVLLIALEAWLTVVGCHFVAAGASVDGIKVTGYEARR